MAVRPPERPAAPAQGFTLAAAILPIVAAGLTLLGWQLAVPGLRSILPGLVAMNPVTAICFILAALALLALRSEQARPGARGFACACAAAVSLVGLIKLGEILLGWGPGIDQLLFRDELEAQVGLPPNRMAPNTALGFLMVGTALLTLDWRTPRGRRPAQALVLFPLLLSLMAVIGYAYGVRGFYRVASYIPMALNTALSFFTLSAGIVFARPQRGLAAVILGRDAGGLMMRRLLPAAILVLAVSGWLEIAGEAAGIYDGRFGVCLLVVSSIVLLAATIWLNALPLRRADIERQRATDALQEAHLELEQRVTTRTMDLAAANRELECEIAERRNAEAKLGKLMRAVEQSADLILITDRQGVIEYVNPAFEALTGYAQAEVLGQSPRLLKSGRQDPELYQELWKTVLEGGTFRAVLVNRKKNGDLYHEEKTVSPVRDEHGTITHIISTGRDITERTRLEEQLRQSQKMEAVGRLAGGVAHDFNNLLTVITGYCQLARRRPGTDDAVLQDIAEVQKAAMRAATLTRQLLAFSRQQVLQPRVLDLNVVVTEMDSMLRRLIGADVDLLTAPAGDLGHVRADPGQIEQVLMNLVVNARDAMSGGGKLTIETANVEIDQAYAQSRVGLRPGQYVMLAVTDTGCGMDAETRARIFEPFFTTKEVGRGTGLGLSTVHGIVSQSGGHIEVYSEPQQGTTFKIYLPRVEAAVDPTGLAEVPGRSMQGTETVLIVEDEEQVRAVVRETLQLNGYAVLEAANGWEAIRIGERGDVAIHLVLTDVIMPGVSGPDLQECLAQLQPEARVLYMSGYTDKAIIHQGVLGSDTPFLQKPFGPDALLRKVREVLDEPRRRAA